MFRYIGPHLDPHRHEYFPGMTRHVAGRTAELLDPLLSADAEPGVAELRQLTDHDGFRCLALIYRKDGAVCGFVRRIHDGEAYPDGTAMVAGIRAAFPELFAGHTVPFAVFRDDTPPGPASPIEGGAACDEPKSEATSQEASASTGATTARRSPRAKSSPKSSA